MNGFVILLMLMFLGSLGIVYFFVTVYDKYFNTKKQQERDRKIIEDLGDQQINYSSNYFNKLTQRSQVGDNLPTQSCENCGAAFNPDDRFCSKCGQEK